MALSTAKVTQLSAGVLFLLGVILSGGGAYLLWLGGSPYYVVTGAVLLIAGVLYLRGNLWSERSFALLLIGTLTGYCLTKRTHCSRRSTVSTIQPASIQGMLSTCVPCF